MAPPNWATTEQLKFLHGYMPMFVDYTAKENQSKFWPRLSEEWFCRWPELDVLIKDGRLPPEARASDHDVPGDPHGESPKYQMTIKERELYGAAIKTRKQQLKNWIRNNNRKAAGASKLTQTRVSTSTLGLLNPRKRQRMHQEQEVYHRLYKDKLESLVKEALAKHLPELQNVPDVSDDADESDDDGGDLSKGKATDTNTNSLKKIRALRMKILHEVRGEAWANESAEVRRQVKEEIMREKEEAAEITGQESKVRLERSPESRELIISNLMAVLKDTCAEIHRLSGWSTIALTGGPNPALKNKISLQTVTFGQTAAGNSFNESYAGFQNDFIQPYLSWLKTVYSDPLKFSTTTAPTAYTSDGAAGKEDSTEPESEDRPASPPLTSSRFTPPPTSPPSGADGPSSDLANEHPFQLLSESRPVTPMPDFHLRNDNGSPSEPISWAFHHQGLGDSSDVEPQISPLAAFEKEDSSSPQPAISDDQIDPMLRCLPAVSTPPADVVNPFLINPVSHKGQPLAMDATTAHRLTSFTAARPNFVSTFLSGGSLVAPPTSASVSTTATASASTNTLLTPVTSPQRAQASAIILTSLSAAPSSASTLAAAPPTLSSTPPAAAATLLNPTSSPPAQVLRDPHGLQSCTAVTGNTSSPNETELLESGIGARNAEGGTQPRGRGRGRGRGQRGRGRGGQGGRGGPAKENTSMGMLSAASRRRIAAINKIVYPADGVPVAPLGASLSTNVDGLYPCITFQAPPPAAVPKKRSWDVVSEADIVAGKRMRKERVREN